jgi:uncharacterized membrane protein (DUF485 family)
MPASGEYGSSGVPFYEGDRGEASAAPGASRAPTAIDWEAIEAGPEFRELVARKRRFVVPATIFFLCWYLGFIVLAGYAEDFMGKSVYEGLTVGYVLALSQFVMVWGLSWWYLRKADREFDPLERRVVQQATQRGEAARAAEPAVTQEVRS